MKYWQLHGQQGKEHWLLLLLLTENFIKEKLISLRRSLLKNIKKKS